MKYHIKDCPVNRQLLPLHSRWAFPMLVELKNPTAFADLKRALFPITGKMLSSCLEKAKKEGYITKSIECYQLTSKGVKFLNVLKKFAKGSECSGCRGSPDCNS